MQAVKDKLNDMSAMRKAKANAKAEEKAEKELAKARVDIAHEVRLAREAEAEMELHVTKAGERAEREIAKHASNQQNNASTTPTPTPIAANTTTSRTTAPGAPLNYTTPSAAPRNQCL